MVDLAQILDMENLVQVIDAKCSWILCQGAYKATAVTSEVNDM